MIRRSTMTRTVLAGAVLAVALTGCTSATETTGPAPTEVTREVTLTKPPTSPATTPPPVTVTVTTPVEDPAASTGAAPVAELSWPEAEPGECPYLSKDDAARFNGQRVGRIDIRPMDPYPVCDFYRSDGGWSASIAVVVTADEATATELVNQAAPIDASNPAEIDYGWQGGYWVKDAGAAPEIFNADERAVYAVSKDEVAVIVTSNEALTNKARRFAQAAIGELMS